MKTVLFCFLFLLHVSLLAQSNFSAGIQSATHLKLAKGIREDGELLEDYYNRSYEFGIWGEFHPQTDWALRARISLQIHDVYLVLNDWLNDQRFVRLNGHNFNSKMFRWPWFCCEPTTCRTNGSFISEPAPR